MKKYFAILSSAVFAAFAFAAKDSSPAAFKAGSNVCFLGDSITQGGKYVKNTAGYDLAALFSGSRGAYGIVTSLTIRLLPFKPKTAKPAAFAPWRPKAVERKLKSALDANNILNPFYFEEAPHEN